MECLLCILLINWLFDEGSDVYDVPTSWLVSLKGPGTQIYSEMLLTNLIAKENGLVYYRN